MVLPGGGGSEGGVGEGGGGEITAAAVGPFDAPDGVPLIPLPSLLTAPKVPSRGTPDNDDVSLPSFNSGTPPSNGDSLP